MSSIASWHAQHAHSVFRQQLHQTQPVLQATSVAVGQLWPIIKANKSTENTTKEGAVVQSMQNDDISARYVAKQVDAQQGRNLTFRIQLTGSELLRVRECLSSLTTAR